MARTLGIAKRDSQQAGLAAREAALELIGASLRQRRSLDSQLTRLTPLGPRDAGFARALASQTLRHLGILQQVIGRFMHKPLAAHKSGMATEILLLGACELLVLRSAAYASVNAANQLALKDPQALHFRALINAVLRRIASQGQSVMAELDQARLATPDWLWDRWCAQYGEQATRTIATAHLSPPPLDIVLKSADSQRPPAVPLFGHVERLCQSGRVEALKGFGEGDWWIQDAAASLPALLFGDVRAKSVIDLCAAPGGKTMQLAAQGAHVVAVERDGERAARLSDNLHRTKLEAEILLGDARDVNRTAACVLVDAPCSATGTIRRHPELPWIKNASDVTQAALMAYEILEGSAGLVEKGGLLVFCVCSLEREEGQEQVNAFLRAHREFEIDPIAAEQIFGHDAWIDAQGALRTLPCHLAELGGMDGFYAARLKRIG